MLDGGGKVATLFRRAEGPGFGSSFLYMRRDLVERYASRRNMRLVQAVVGERDLSYKSTRRGLSDSLRESFQRQINVSSRVVGLVQ